MKRIASIAFVLIILLNTMGYYVVFIGLHYKNDLNMARALDADIYSLSSSITLKVPVSIPYMTDAPGFVRVNGQFEHNGELYRMVKQRYAKDTLTVVCVKDTQHKKIDLALSDYVKTFSDKAADAKSSTKTSITFIKDYLPISFKINSATQGWWLKIIPRSHQQILTPTFYSSIAPPPKELNEMLSIN